MDLHLQWTPTSKGGYSATHDGSKIIISPDKYNTGRWAISYYSLRHNARLLTRGKYLTAEQARMFAEYDAKTGVLWGINKNGNWMATTDVLGPVTITCKDGQYLYKAGPRWKAFMDLRSAIGSATRWIQRCDKPPPIEETKHDVFDAFEAPISDEDLEAEFWAEINKEINDEA